MAELDLAGSACLEWQLGDDLRENLVHEMRKRLMDDWIGTAHHRLRARGGRVLGALGDPRTDETDMAPSLIQIQAEPLLMVHTADSASETNPPCPTRA